MYDEQVKSAWIPSLQTICQGIKAVYIRNQNLRPREASEAERSGLGLARSRRPRSSEEPGAPTGGNAGCGRPDRPQAAALRQVQWVSLTPLPHVTLHFPSATACLLWKEHLPRDPPSSSSVRTAHCCGSPQLPRRLH